MERMKEFCVSGEDELVNQPNVVDPDYYKIILDNSGSMDGYQRIVRDGLNDYKERLSSIDEATGIFVSRGDFELDYIETSYLPIESFKTSYFPYGLTDLYGAIVKSTRSSINKYKELIGEGYEPRMTNIFFTDGFQETRTHRTMYSFEDAKKIVQEATEMGITMVFIDFGNKNGSIPRELGFESVYSPKNSAQALVDTIRNITDSCIRQSQSKISNPEDWFGIKG